MSVWVRAVVPFRLQALGYDAIGSKTGWLVAAYAAGLIVSSPPIVSVLRFRRTSAGLTASACDIGLCGGEGQGETDASYCCAAVHGWR